MYQYIMRLLKNEDAASAVEYALVVGLIALAIVLAATALGGGIAAVFNRIVTTLAGI